MRVLLVIHDNDSYVHNFPMGSAYIAAYLEAAGIEVDIYNQDVHHWPNQHLTTYLNNNQYDAVGLGVIAGYYPFQKMLEISEAIHSSNRNFFYFLGGPGPSAEPEYFLRKTRADAVVIGEGEETALELMRKVAGKEPLNQVKGLAYREGDEVAVNERRPVIKEIDSIPWPAYEKFPFLHYQLIGVPHRQRSDKVMTMITGRGCPFRCNFCYRMDPGVRLRDPEAIVEEMRHLKTNYGINYITFQDELLMTSEKRTEELCRAFIKAGLNMRWLCSGRLNFAKLDTLKLMKEAGCVFVNYGIESMDDQALRNMNKKLTTKQIVKGIEATLAAGLSPGFNIIFGNIGENQEVLQKDVEFLLKYDDGSQMRTIRPVTPYPGSDLYYHAIENGLIKDCADFYENKHLNSDLLSVNFTDLSDDEFHDALHEANHTLINNYYENKCAAVLEETRHLYAERDTSFRGYRHP